MDRGKFLVAAESLPGGPEDVGGGTLSRRPRCAGQQNQNAKGMSLHEIVSLVLDDSSCDDGPRKWLSARKEIVKDVKAARQLRLRAVPARSACYASTREAPPGAH